MTLASPSGSGVAGPRRSPWLGAAALYTTLTLVYAWPLLPVLASHLPFDAADPGLNAWILWWNTQALPLTERWWNAPIFAPITGALALSETLLALTPLTTPVQWLGGGPVLAYNLAFLLSYPTAALAAHALAHRVTGRHDAALVAGLAYGFSPYRAAHLPHLQMLWSCWMPLALLALHRYVESRRPRFLAIAGLCWVLNGLTTGYYLMFFAVLAGIWTIWFARSWRDWLAIAATTAASSALLTPLLTGYQQRQQALGLARHLDEIERFSADLTAVWASRHVWLPDFWTRAPRAEGELYAGVVVLALAIAGVGAAWWMSPRRRWARWRIVLLVLAGYLAEAVAITAMLGPWETTVFGQPVSMRELGKPLFVAAVLALIAVLAGSPTANAWRRRSPLAFYAAAAVLMLAFALGPVGRFQGEDFWYGAPYSWLMQLPGGAALRVPARFGMLFMLCLAISAACAVARLAPRGLGRAATAALAMGIALEGWVPVLPTAEAARPLVLTEGSSEAPLLEMPSPDLFTDVAAMLRAIGHGRPLVNGFSGYRPHHYQALVDGLAAHDPDVLAVIRGHGPVLVLIHEPRDPESRHLQFISELPGSERIGDTPFGPLYRLTGLDVEPAAVPDGAVLRIASIEADPNPRLAPHISDGRLDTRWHSIGQVRGDVVTIQLAESAAITGLALDLGQFSAEHPRRLRVEVADGAGPKAEIWEGRTGGLTVAAALTDPEHVTLPLAFDEPVRGDRIVLTQLDTDPTTAWSIAELRVYGR